MRSLLGVVRDAFGDPAPLPGQDPWLVAFEGGHLLVQSADGDRRVVVREVVDVDRMTVGPAVTVWAPSRRWGVRGRPRHDRQLWAPELHLLDDRWYLYLAASDGVDAHHRSYVLVADSPFGPYREIGWIGDAAHDEWAIDLTVLEHAGHRYAIWSGWETAAGGEQHLYLAPMCDPATIVTPRVRIASPTHPWERSIAPINEGPQVLRRPDGQTFVLFAADASWSTAYATGVLELVGSDPLDPSAWHKHPEPLLVGGGHGCAVESDTGLRYVHHRKTGCEPGWSDRVIVSVPLGWSARGLPVVTGPSIPARAPGAAPSVGRLPG